MSVHKLVNLRLNLWRLVRDDGEQERKRTRCCGSVEWVAPWRWSHMRRQNVGSRDRLMLKAILTCLCPDNVLDNDKLEVDFQPLYQCIHIYTTLDSLDELRRSYQADRKVLFPGSLFSFRFSLLLVFL